MKIVQDFDEEEWYIDTGELNLDSDPIRVHNADGYGGTDIWIEAGNMTWKQVDTLIEALQLAKKIWMKEKK